MKRILFVDDESQVLAGLRAALYSRRRDWDMHFAIGGENGLAMLAQSPFDVVIADIRMPGIGGAELLHEVCSRSPQTIRIVLSGYANELQSLRLLSLAHLFLSKPCQPARLEACIERCIGVQELIRSETLRGRLGLITNLEPMPSTFAALQRALADPGVDANKVAQVIQNDPGIAAKVLQCCNSAFFRLPRRVSSVKQAVSYLGLSTVRAVTIAAEVFKPDPRLPANLDLAQLQSHALSVASVARSIAANAPWADDAFLAGLLHDVGLLALGKLFPREMQLALEAIAQGLPLADAEEMHLGIDHATAGAYLLGLWGLPYEVVDTVARHELEDPQSVGVLNPARAVAIAHALLCELRPEEMPSYDADCWEVDDDYLLSIGCPCSWAVLKQNTLSMLTPEGPI